MTTLPPLSWYESPNQSSRHGIVPHLIVVHRPVGSYTGSIQWLCDPKADASAHVITEHDRATQLVRWDRKAWACVHFNAMSYNLEIDDNAWDGSDAIAWKKAARIVAFLCHKTGIPPRWSKRPTHTPGVARHYDLGLAGGGHTDPTTKTTVWLAFMEEVQRQAGAGGFRKRYGRGLLVRL